MTATPLLLAVDAGGSSTRALIVEPDGTCVGFGIGPAGNPTSAGTAQALRGVAAAADAALRQAARPASAMSAVMVAMAGSLELLRPDQLRDAIGFTGDPAQLHLVSDILAMYYSGALEPSGCAVVAGTGSIAARLRGGRLSRIVGGSGWLLGDGGSGFAIGHGVVRAVVGELDGTSEATALTPLLLTDLGIQEDGKGRHGRAASLERMSQVLYGESPVLLARFAPLAFAAREDVVAAGIVERAQNDLAALVVAARGDDTTGPVVLGGSVMHAALAAGRHRSAALVAALEGTDVRPVRDGALGAAVLGLMAARRPLRPSVTDQLRATAVLVAPTFANGG